MPYPCAGSWSGRRGRGRVPLIGAAPVGAAAPGRVVIDTLTRREREVLEHVAWGRTNQEIAHTLFISVRTAGVHVSHILAKLGAANRAEAARIARDLLA
ncbi:MAG: hypothetical protein AUI14_05090 [Actinobacteria bacterium 13_2_20CM_2_71_6]|nr:MAG: hypothetical protein AUI14_05090 [Actinobacteria bacterium 13_2_20CM_2_71_6]